MTIAVVTGGAGFIGSNLVDRLIDLGTNVVILDDFSTGDPKNVNPKATLVKGSICNERLVNKVLGNAEYVFHAAALPRIQPSFDDPASHNEVNVTGTIHCLQAVKNSSRLKKFVFSSSSACYGNPPETPTTESAPVHCLSPYALQKYTAEQYCLILGQRFNIPVVALRYFNVYGPRSFNPANPYNAYTSVVGIFQHQRKNNQSLTVTGDGTQSRDFVHIYDVAEANLAAAFSEVTNEVYNVGCGKAYTVLETARMFSDDFSFIPERKGEAKITLAAIDRIRNELDWVPRISLPEGIQLLEG